MGASISSNTTNMTNDIVSNIGTNISNNSSQYLSADQECTVTMGKGAVIGGDLNMKQKIALSGDAIFSTITSQDSQIKMSQDAQQKAKAEISGLNFGSVAAANNTANLMNNSIVNMTTNISNNCSSALKGKQICGLDMSQGGTIEGNANLSQSVASKLKCATDTSSSQSSSQAVSQAVKQTAISKVTGLSLTGILIALAILLAVLFGAPVLSVAFLGKKIIKLILTLFPIILISIGIILVIVGQVQNSNAKGKGAALRIYTKSIISPNPDISCLPVKVKDVTTEYQDPETLISDFGIGKNNLNKYAGFEMNKVNNVWETTFIIKFNRNKIPCTNSTKFDNSIPGSKEIDNCTYNDSCSEIGNVCKDPDDTDKILICAGNNDNSDYKWLKADDLKDSNKTISPPTRIIGYRRSDTTLIWVGVATIITGVLFGIGSILYILNQQKTTKTTIDKPKFGRKKY